MITIHVGHNVSTNFHQVAYYPGEPLAIPDCSEILGIITLANNLHDVNSESASTITSIQSYESDFLGIHP
jgi:hypothetical protein